MRSSSGSVTLKDVAERAGVSVTTVSKILNGREMGVPIREETRTRVLALAAELGYRPNMLARGLRGSSSSLLGVIARDIADPFHIQILRGINSVVRTHGYRMFLGHVDYEAEVTISYGSMFERSHADGILVLGDIEGGETAMAVLAGLHRSVVGVTDRTGPGPFPGVYSDNRQGMLLALEHLWELGHRAIACVSDARTADGRLRLDLYEAFMRERGAGGAIRMYVTDQEPEPAYQLGQRIFAAPPVELPSAILATSDTTAIGLLQAAWAAGVDVPGQVSIMGYDDVDLAAFTIPPLTTISQDGVAMGETAAALLIDMIERGHDRSVVEDVVLVPRLVERRSTGAPTLIPALDLEVAS